MVTILGSMDEGTEWEVMVVIRDYYAALSDGRSDCLFMEHDEVLYSLEVVR